MKGVSCAFLVAAFLISWCWAAPTANNPNRYAPKINIYNQIASPGGVSIVDPHTGRNVSRNTFTWQVWLHDPQKPNQPIGLLRGLEPYQCPSPIFECFFEVTSTYYMVPYKPPPQHYVPKPQSSPVYSSVITPYTEKDTHVIQQGSNLNSIFLNCCYEEDYTVGIIGTPESLALMADM